MSLIASRTWRPPDAVMHTDLGTVSAAALAAVPERWARRFNVLPLSMDDRRLVLAAADAGDIECERVLAFAVGRQVELLPADPAAVARRINEVYRHQPDPPPAAQLPGWQHDAPRLTGLTRLAGAAHDDTGATVTTLVDELLAQGIAARASDIHIEPEEDAIAVRHRVDGVLTLVRRLPRALAPALVSRIKIMSSLDIADRLRPQDGRARVGLHGMAVDLRISTLPASHGEKVVVRVLDRRSAVLSLEGIGFHADELQRIHQLLDLREGLVLVTGPTGSGKTTTLYAALARLRARGVNIVTVEDPVEYRLPGIVQVQVNEKAGLTFASALRSIMRQDPDVLLIGEIRDRETAEIAIQASLTGHLVLSTLHTNDAASAVTRLVDIGVAPYKIATALKGVVAQRLVRRSCPGAGATQSRVADGGGAGWGGVRRPGGASVPAPPCAPGCSHCAGTGYRGRLPVSEVLIGTAELELRIAAGDTAERLAQSARAGGMRSMWASGMAHVAAGATTHQEVRRVTAPDAVGGAAPAASVTGTAPTADIPTFPPMTDLVVGVVAGVVLHRRGDDWQVLVLRRASGARCAGSWESVHGRIEPHERPEDAVVREVGEETGLAIQRLYNVSVQPIYLHRLGAVQLSVVFAAIVTDTTVTLGVEHDAADWVPVGEAMDRVLWGWDRAAIGEAARLLRTGDAGPAEDVLRVM
jgi:type II secretory ATPase GspE/PulE/Tfp pilus assembly ATPase PilB-like protein/8-oxo-dGTP pyrophosphatase MutT (NUDIX family)